MVMEDKFIEISFNNQKFLRYPKVKIFIDGDLLEEKTFEKQKETVCIPVDMIDGDHLLEIEHFDKTNRDTEYKNGEILRYGYQNFTRCLSPITTIYEVSSQFIT